MASRRPEFYLSVGYDWYDYEASAFLLVATPPVYAYHSYEEIADGQAMVKAIAVAEFSFLSLLPFSHSAVRGTMFRESSDPRVHNNTGVLLPLGRRLRDLVGAVGFTTILEGCYLDKSHDYLAYRLSAEVG